LIPSKGGIFILLIMALPAIISKTDFKGYYNVELTGYSLQDNEVSIVNYEAYYLKKLMGEVMYADYAANSSATKWTDFLNGKTYTDLNGELKVWSRLDLKNMLLGFIYYELVKASRDEQTITGYVRAKNENSERVSDLKQLELTNERFNKSISFYHKAYYFFLNFNTVYTEWEYTAIDFKEIFNY
jgi:hypothetical protein